MVIDLKNIKADMQNIFKAVGFVYRSDRKYFKLRFFMILLQSIFPLISLFMLKLLIDEVAYCIQNHVNDFSHIWYYAGLFAVIFLLTRLSGSLTQFSDSVLSQKLTDFICDLLHKKSTVLDLSYYDNPKYHDTFHRAQQEANYRPIQLLNNLTDALKEALSLAGIIVILFTLSWLGIIVIIIAGFPFFYVKIKKSSLIFNWRNKSTSLFRKANYISMLMTHRNYAKEIRVFNLARYFQKQFVDIRQKLMKELFIILKRLTMFEIVPAIIEGITLMTIILLIGHKAFSGSITIGSFVMLFEAFRRGQGAVQGIVTDLSGIYENKLFLNNLFEFLKLEPHISSPEKKIAFPYPLRNGVKFENVSFCYPGSDKMVIENLSFEAKPGTITYLKGRNGTGKTTIMKLLCRLYDCTNGKITIDDIDIKNFDINDLRKNISVIFQDFVQYDLTVKENIVIGDIGNSDDWNRIYQSAKISQAEQIIMKLPSGYDTLLGKYFEKGEELSMGQWQRIALCRTLFKHSPILFLDEPVSWVDEEAELKFENYIRNFNKNKILFIVSHSRTGKIEYVNESSSYRINSLNNQVILT